MVFHLWIHLISWIQKWGSPIVSHPHSPVVVRGAADARTGPFSVVAGCTGPRHSRLGYASMAFCRCPLFLKPAERNGRSSRGLRLALFSALHRNSLSLGNKEFCCYVVRMRRRVRACFGRLRAAPAPRFLICVQSGAFPTSASAVAGPGLSTAATFVACNVECWSWGGKRTASW